MRCIMTIHNGDGVVIAVDEGGNTVRIDWDASLEVGVNHRKAVEALYKQQGWIFHSSIRPKPGQQYLGIHKGISVAVTVDSNSVTYANASSKLH